MTLIIAGHHLEKSWDIWGKEEVSDITSSPKMESNGLFVASDSVITSATSHGDVAILGGFRKIYPVQIKVWEPDFIESTFNGYRNIYYESECFVAFAGNTLTAQHVLNFISTHLRQIHISVERSRDSEKYWEYKIIRHCQKNILEENRWSTTWGEDMFTPDDCRGIVTAVALADIIEYSINEALSSAQKYKLDEMAFKSMYTEFVAGIYCPISRSHKLYTFRFNFKMNNGVRDVYAEKYDVPEDEVVVLGMRNEFEERANKIFKDSIHSGATPARELFRFLNDAISEVRKSGSYQIDRPSVLRTFSEGRLDQVEYYE